MSPYGAPLLGAALIGLGAAILLVLNGRVAGMSGIAAGMLPPWTPGTAWRLVFLAGLLSGPAAAAAFGIRPVLHGLVSAPLLVVAGLLVGFGTRLGSGCTSGWPTPRRSRWGGALLAVTLVPVLMLAFIRGRIVPEGRQGAAGVVIRRSVPAE